MNDLKFTKIDRPHMQGETATVGNRTANVVLAEDGPLKGCNLWRCFCYENGRQSAVRDAVQYDEAMRHARTFLTGGNVAKPNPFALAMVKQKRKR